MDLGSLVGTPHVNTTKDFSVKFKLNLKFNIYIYSSDEQKKRVQKDILLTLTGQIFVLWKLQRCGNSSKISEDIGQTGLKLFKNGNRSVED